MLVATLPLIPQTHWIGWIFRIAGVVYCMPLMLLSTRLPGALLSMGYMC